VADCGGFTFSQKDPVHSQTLHSMHLWEGHASYVLSGRRGSKRFSIYIPDDLAPDIQQAIENGRQLQELINEAGCGS